MKLVLASLACALSAGGAQACLAPDFETHALFAQRPQARLADGLEILRVQVDDPAGTQRGDTASAIATVLEDRLGFRAGEKVRIEADMGSSCSRWGYVEGPAYAIGYVRRRPGSLPVFDTRSFRTQEARPEPVKAGR